MTGWLTLVGIGDDGLAGLTARGRERIDAAEVLVGGARHLAMVSDDDRERHAWPTPFSGAFAMLEGLKPKRVAALTSGDPMWFGMGATLARRFPANEIDIVPHISSFALAAAWLGWPLAETECLTLHGRPAASLEAHIAPGARLLILSENGATPAEVAWRLVARGFGPSPMTLMEHLGGGAERVRETCANAFVDDALGDIADLNLVAVECVPGDAPLVLANSPGLPDGTFSHDGQITRREVRAATLARLVPLLGQTLWDVGAGSGAIAIEWLRTATHGRAIAIEKNADRILNIEKNAAALGVPALEIRAGEAPDAFADLPPPDAIFIGGGIATRGEALIDAALPHLRPGGRLVANAVTVGSEAVLASAQARHGGDLVRIAISRAEPVGPHLGWRPLMPVTQWAWQNPWGAS